MAPHTSILRPNRNAPNCWLIIAMYVLVLLFKSYISFKSAKYAGSSFNDISWVTMTLGPILWIVITQLSIIFKTQCITHLFFYVDISFSVVLFCIFWRNFENISYFTSKVHFRQKKNEFLGFQQSFSSIGSNLRLTQLFLNAMCTSTVNPFHTLFC